eukprot:14949295-Alexandrium_andersonii.AAC.1
MSGGRGRTRGGVRTRTALTCPSCATPFACWMSASVHASRRHQVTHEHQPRPPPARTSSGAAATRTRVRGLR